MRAPEHCTAYKDWAPTQCDTRGLTLDDRQEWLVCPTMRTRDSGCLDASNFAAAVKTFEALPDVGDEPSHEVHRFGHWGPGWFEIILVHPAYAEQCGEIVCALSDYPILDEHDFSQREDSEAQRVWADCYNASERIAYIRKHRSQFEFRSLSDMLGCVRGLYFAGYASELIG